MSYFLTVDSLSIRSVDGLYSLNDLHRASGGEIRHRPSTWIQNQQTQELIKEIEAHGIPCIFVKQGVGTFACKELVIAYAAWISPAFHLKVIRVFLGTSNQFTQPTNGVYLDEAEAFNLYGVLQIIKTAKPHLQRAEKILRAAESPHAPFMYDIWHELSFRISESVYQRCRAVYQRRRIR